MLSAFWQLKSGLGCVAQPFVMGWSWTRGRRLAVPRETGAWKMWQALPRRVVGGSADRGGARIFTRSGALSAINELWPEILLAEWRVRFGAGRFVCEAL